ncbi:hypothetical protein [Pareuzebyella sediminis]|uniref:hypothetical protein n=1 Tax=Pareuzebyella sediminis TaxID=2607998 RepID=UPI0011EC7AD6|nr:hypothetical protein [Pareuzebyella sediminis]
MNSSHTVFLFSGIGKAIGLVLLLTVLTACKQKASDNATPSGGDAERTVEESTTNETPTTQGKLLLFEDHIGTIPLPFPRKNMLSDLREAFRPLTVTKEIGQQDGPDFPLYSIRNGSKEVAYFSMDFEDTLALVELRINSEWIADEYGLSVGDKFSKIKKQRKDKLNTYSDEHGHTYVSIKNSQIGYEISDTAPPANAPDDALDQVSHNIRENWEITTVIWRAASSP